jgi:hypothetical protein
MNVKDYLKYPIIISNGVACLNHKARHIIDQFNIVVRLNNFVIDGYEEYVGTKTDIWVHNSNSDICLPKNIDNIKQIINWDHYAPNRLKFEKYSEKYIGRVMYRNYENICDDYKSPSLGLNVISYLIDEYGLVICYGFDGMVTGHYFNIPHMHYNGHNSDNENKVREYYKINGKLLNLYEDINVDCS